MNKRIETIEKEVADITNELINIIADAIKNHNNHIANFLESVCDTPIIFESDTDDGIYSLDRVRIENDRVIFEISNSWDCSEVFANEVDLEKLLFVAKLINEDNLYIDYDIDEYSMA